MTLRRRHLITALAVAIPAALVLSQVFEWRRDTERRLTLTHMVDAQMTDIVREACEADPQWFLAGPRADRPSAAERALPNADVLLRRPTADPLPIEIFPYTEQYSGSSPASPRFPAEFRSVLRSSPTKTVLGPFETDEGDGLQMAIETGWTPGPCAVLLMRLRPIRGQGFERVAIFAGLLAMSFLVAFVATQPTEARVQRLAQAARESARQEYTVMTPVSGKDDVAALAFVINEAASEIRRRSTATHDREAAFRRYVDHTMDEVAVPLAELERTLTGPALREAHQVASHMANLAATARLRMSGRTATTVPVDVNAMVDRLVRGRAPLASTASVDLDADLPTEPVRWAADEALLEQAVANVIDNAIVHNRPGGHVSIAVRSFEHGDRFSLTVTDDGPGVDDETFTLLSANKRFRGDEGRSGRLGRGLGLALAREVADRFGLRLEMRRPSAGGFEVEFSVRD